MIGSSDAEAILNGLSVAVLVVDPDEAIIFVNPAAEQFFQLSILSLIKSALPDLVLPDNPLLSLISKARVQDSVIREFGFRLSTPRLGTRSVTVDCAPLGGNPGYLVLSFQEHASAGRLGGTLQHRDSRAVPSGHGGNARA